MNSFSSCTHASALTSPQTRAFEMQEHSNSAHQRLALSCLRIGRLHVKEDFGAGLELSHCDQGFLVEKVEVYPGQPDLQASDIIVAIETSMLCGMGLEDINECFGAGFHDGALVLYGSESDLVNLSTKDIEEAARACLGAHYEARQDSPLCTNPFFHSEAHQEQGKTVHNSVDQKTLPEVSLLAPNDADSGVQVSADRCQVVCNNSDAKKWLGVRGGTGVLHGLYQFEVEVVGTSLLRVGVGTATARRAVGKDGRSFGYGGTAMKSTGGNFEEYGDKFEAATGSVVTCLLDRRDPKQQTLSFCLNGKHQGIAFNIPEQMTELPLFPMVCGRGTWQALCRFTNLEHPSSDYQPWANALQIGDAVAKQEADDELPQGMSPRDASAVVKAGHLIALYVIDGSWEGWHKCEVLDVDALGCYLRHQEDEFTETIPWSFLSGRYRMQLLSNGDVSHFGQNQESRLNVIRSSCCIIKDTICKLADWLPEDERNLIDSRLTTRQQTLIMWLASQDLAEDKVMLGASETGLASSEALQEWLQVLQLSAHSDEIKAWCEEEGAVSLIELIQNRAELAAALHCLSPGEISRLQSEAAADEAEAIQLRALKDELVSLLSLIMKSLDGAMYQSMRRQCCFSSEEWTFIEAAAAIAGSSECTATAGRASQKVTSTLERSGVVTSAAASISRRDRQLLQVAVSLPDGAQSHLDHQRCENCGLSFKQQTGYEGFSEDDGCFYCEACWADWLSNSQSFTQESKPVFVRSFSQGGA